jgi:hypothetical protein
MKALVFGKALSFHHFFVYLHKRLLCPGKKPAPAPLNASVIKLSTPNHQNSMRKNLLFSVLALLFSFHAFSQAVMPYAACPDAGIAIARAGLNANTTNPFYLYDVNATTGAAMQVPGGPYKHPMAPAQNLQVNAIGVNRMDGFIYGLSADNTITSARLLRLDKNYGVTDLGVLPPPASLPFQIGVINTAAGDMDDEGNYWFTAATAFEGTGQITAFFLGKVSNVAMLSGAGPLSVTYYLVNATASCIPFAAALAGNPDNIPKDLSFNTTTKTFFIYVTYSAFGAPPYSGQVVEVRPAAGSSPMQYEVMCTPVVNTNTAEVAGTLIDNAGNFLVLLTDGTIGRIGSPSPNVYNGLYIPLNNTTGLPNPLRGDMASCHAPTPTTMQWYRDFDNDGFGDPAKPLMAPTQPVGYVDNNLDCNDYKVMYQDNDGEGWGSNVKVPCGGVWRTGDCNDNDPKIHSLQTFYRDADGDSYGDRNNMIQQCTNTPPAGYVRNSIDCNDNDRMVYWAKSYYRDADGDGLGDPSNMIAVCSSTPPAGYVSNKNDTNDTPVMVMNATPNRQAGALAAAENAAVTRGFAVGAYPNPFGGTTRIQYTVPADATINVRVFDVLGREVSLVFNGRRSAGTHYAEYNAAKLSAGVYYLRMTAAVNGKEQVQTQKLVKVE